MQTFLSRIKAIVHMKSVARKVTGKPAKLSYYQLSALDQQRLVMALVNENMKIRAIVAMEIDNAIREEWCDSVTMSESKHNDIHFRELELNDIAQRSHDMNLAGQGR